MSEKYRTREEYWRARGREDVARTVQQRTVKALRKKGVCAPPESAVYKKEFDRLAGIYRSEREVMLKKRKALNEAWLAEHSGDTDEQLLAYLREAVTEPEQMGKAGSVPGGFFLTRRFGSWKKALAAAGLLPPEETQTPPEEQAQSPPEEK